MRRSVCALLLAFFFLCSLSAQQAAQVSGINAKVESPSETSQIPTVVSFSGILPTAAANVTRPANLEGVTFLLYSEPQGGQPLWMETQTIHPDAAGHYSVSLGVTTQGLPRDLFTGGQARWLGIQVAGEAEQPRVLLVAVPYALKAADAETLGGLHPSDFQLAKPAASPTQPNSTSAAKSAAATTVTGTGTSGYLPLWTSASVLSNSALFQKTGFLGLGTISPTALLDVNGKTNLRDTLTLFPKSTDVAMQIPGTTFRIDQTGKLTFVPGQLFPGTGTLTGITTGVTSGLQGGGTTGNLSLSIKAAGVANTMLQHPGLTIPVTAPLIGGGAVSLGASATAISLKPCPAGQALVSNGTTWSCSAVASGTGSVKSVALSAPSTDFTVTGSPLTSSGTLRLNWTVPPTTDDIGNALVKRAANGDITAHTIVADGGLISNQGLFVASGASIAGSVGIGIGTPLAELHLNANGTANADSLLIGNTTTKGLLLRDTGSAVDIGSLGVPLAINNGNTQPTYFGSPAYFNFGVGIGTNTPQAELNLNAGGTANADTLLLGNNTTRGLQLRDNGSGMDIESFGTGLNVNFATRQPIILNPNGNIDSTGFPVGASVLMGTADTSLGQGYNAETFPVLTVGAFSDSTGSYYSAFFSNDVVIGGNLRVLGSKNFHIPHPLDPEHKFLDHAAIESSEVLNQYSGNVTLNEKGEARVEFPDWFSALNTDFRYQLTAIGAPGPGLYVSEEVDGNHFSIAGGKPGSKVSWQVTGRRNDEYMRQHPFQLETERTQAIRPQAAEKP